MRNHSICYRMAIGHHWCLAVVLLLGLSACDRNGSPRDLEDYVASLKKPVSPAVFNPSLPIPRTYEADNLRSPFESAQRVLKGAGVNQLQAYPVTMLRFAGTVSGSKGTLAYVLTPDNLVYQVGMGDLIGDRDGEVISIEPGQIKIAEKEREAGKPVTKNIVTLQLKDER